MTGSGAQTTCSGVRFQLTQAGASAYDPESLRRSLALYNENRALVHELYELRRLKPWKVPTHELYVVMRAGLVLEVEEHTRMLRDYRRLADEAPAVAALADRITAITHDHPEGLKGARATAHAIFRARQGADADQIQDEIVTRFGYDLSRTVDEIRRGYQFN